MEKNDGREMGKAKTTLSEFMQVSEASATILTKLSLS